ncbi:unnamed protein product, partial [Closterium sp. Naga37s-1]
MAPSSRSRSLAELAAAALMLALSPVLQSRVTIVRDDYIRLHSAIASASLLLHPPCRQTPSFLPRSPSLPPSPSSPASPASSQVLQSRLTIASTDSSPAHVDFEYSDSLCGTAWRDDYLRLHSAIRTASAAAYTPPPSPPPPPSSRRLLSLAPTAAAAAVPDPNLSNRTLPDSSIRFLTFDQAGHCGGFGDFLVGLVSSFVAALLDRRAFVIWHDCIQYAFEPAFIDWRLSPGVPMEPSRRTRNLNESFPPGVIPFLDLNGNRMGLQGLERFKAFRHVKVLWNRG